MDLNVFISWSGPRAQPVAAAMSTFLRDVIPGTMVFVSSEDIQKGSRWESEIVGALDRANFGIVCITKDRLNAPWLLFEAGALSRSITGVADGGRVATMLIDLEITDMTRPLTQFQATRATRDDITKLVLEMNAVLGDQANEPARVQRWIAGSWSELNGAITSVPPIPDDEAVPDDPAADLHAKLDEILGFIRSQDRSPMFYSNGEILRGETKPYYFSLQTTPSSPKSASLEDPDPFSRIVAAARLDGTPITSTHWDDTMLHVYVGSRDPGQSQDQIEAQYSLIAMRLGATNPGIRQVGFHEATGLPPTILSVN